MKYLILASLLLVGCTPTPKPSVCPKIIPIKVKFSVDKRGGFNKPERKKAIAVIRYYDYEVRRTNKVIDRMNEKK